MVGCGYRCDGQAVSGGGYKGGHGCACGDGAVLNLGGIRVSVLVTLY